MVLNNATTDIINIQNIKQISQAERDSYVRDLQKLNGTEWLMSMLELGFSKSQILSYAAQYNKEIPDSKQWVDEETVLNTLGLPQFNNLFYGFSQGGGRSYVEREIGQVAYHWSDVSSWGALTTPQSREQYLNEYDKYWNAWKATQVETGPTDVRITGLGEISTINGEVYVNGVKSDTVVRRDSVINPVTFMADIFAKQAQAGNANAGQLATGSWSDYAVDKETGLIINKASPIYTITDASIIQQSTPQTTPSWGSLLIIGAAAFFLLRGFK